MQLGVKKNSQKPNLSLKISFLIVNTLIIFNKKFIIYICDWFKIFIYKCYFNLL